MSWLQPPIILEGIKVKLVPLEQAHFPKLLEIGKQKQIWAHYTTDFSEGDRLQTELKSAVLKRTTGEQYPFAIFDKVQNTLIGSTRFLNIYPEHRKLEIGGTWYDPAYWGTGHNTECKLLLLTHCFEMLQTVRVQFLTDEHNKRSWKAIEKIGATYEGTIRNERIRTNGTIRSSAMFSIVAEEWEKVKGMLTRKATL